MRLIRAAAALLIAVGTGLFVGATPAHAGGWASTVLDPVPATFEPGKSYTVGFWVLQHGSHPFEGPLDPVGLQLVGPGGTTTTFKGIALPEPAHYVTSIVIPAAAGTYTLVGQQGWFQPYLVGTIAAPGALKALPVPPPLTMRAEDLPWKDVRPPDMPVDPERNPFDETVAVPAANTAPAAAATEAEKSNGMRPTATVLAAVAITALVLGLLLVRRRRATPID